MKTTILKNIKLGLGLVAISILCSNCGILFADAGVICPSQDEKSTYNQGDFDTGSEIVETKNTESQRLNDEQKSKAFLSYSVGGGALWPVSEKFSVTTGFLLTGKGVKFENSSFNMEEKTTLTYIDLPAKAHYQIGQSGFNINAGLQPSILVGAKNKVTINGTSSETKGTNNYNTFDIAIGAGAGYRFENGIMLNFGYDHGLSNVINTDNFGGFERKNRALKLSVQYLFN